MSLSPARKIIGGIAIFGTAIGLATFLLTAIMKVQSGHGLETYVTPGGAKFSWVGGLIAFVCAFIVLLVGAAIRIAARVRKGSRR